MLVRKKDIVEFVENMFKEYDILSCKLYVLFEGEARVDLEGYRGGLWLRVTSEGYGDVL